MRTLASFDWMRFIRRCPQVPPCEVPGWEGIGLVLCSGLGYELNFLRNYKSVERLLADRLWLFSLLNAPRKLTVVAGHLDGAQQAAGFRWLDKARDHLHPGPQTHHLLYQGFWAKMVETGGLDKLRSKIR